MEEKVRPYKQLTDQLKTLKIKLIKLIKNKKL